jgi:hypothetical protein
MQCIQETKRGVDKLCKTKIKDGVCPACGTKESKPSFRVRALVEDAEGPVKKKIRLTLFGYTAR